MLSDVGETYMLPDVGEFSCLTLMARDSEHDSDDWKR